MTSHSARNSLCDDTLVQMLLRKIDKQQTMHIINSLEHKLTSVLQTFLRISDTAKVDEVDEDQNDELNVLPKPSTNSEYSRGAEAGGLKLQDQKTVDRKRSKARKCRTWKMPDQITGVENAGPGNDGPRND